MARSEREVISDGLEAAHSDRLRLLFFSLMFLLSACWLYSISHRFLLDPDTFWHIRTGREIWETGRFPFRDEYSHSFFGDPWIAKEWFSQVIFYLAHRVGGWNLVVALTTLVLALTGSLIYFLLSLRINNTAAIIIAYLALILSMQTYLARPHILTFPLLLIWTECLLRASEEERAPSFLLLPIITIWANLHGTYTIGLVIAGLCFLNFFDRVRFRNAGELAKWMLFVSLSAAASLVHPYGYKTVLTTFSIIGNEWLNLSGEWRAVDVVSEPIHELALFVLLFLLLTFGLKLRFAKALFVMVMLHLFLSHIRFAYLFYYLLPLVASFEIEAQYPRLSASSWEAELDDVVTAFLSRNATALTVAAASTYLVITGGFLVLSNVSPREDIAPTRALTFARIAGLRGNVLNSGEFGGFLVFEGIKTFIDGRSDQLFRDTFLGDVWKSLQADGDEALNQQLRDYQIGWTLLRPRDPRIQKLDRNPSWKRAYQDEAAIIHVPAH
jgi:hypothetical protein